MLGWIIAIAATFGGTLAFFYALSVSVNATNLSHHVLAFMWFAVATLCGAVVCLL
jgi:hypothetical protein